MTARIACAIVLSATLAGCATPVHDARQRLDSLLPADALLLGEQHDADAHQGIQRAVVEELARRGQLAALALEMAEAMAGTADPANANLARACLALMGVR